jgi:hypothetical protein
MDLSYETVRVQSTLRYSSPTEPNLDLPDAEHYILLRHNATESGGRLQTLTYCLRLQDPEDGGNRFLRNLGNTFLWVYFLCVQCVLYCLRSFF